MKSVIDQFYRAFIEANKTILENETSTLIDQLSTGGLVTFRVALVRVFLHSD